MLGLPQLEPDARLDLNRYLVRHPAATFFVRVSGDSMTGAGINSGDILRSCLEIPE